MEKITTIFFDIGGVILKKKADFDLLAAKIIGVDILKYKEKLLEIIALEETEKRWQAIDNINKEQAFQIWINRAILESLMIAPSKEKIEQLSKIRYNRSFNYEVIEGVFETLDYLKAKYRLAIISNAPPSRRHFELKDFNLEKYFDPIILSGEIPYYKPQEQIYQLALNLAENEPSRSAMVDNKLENLQAAAKMSFGQCLLFNSDQIVQDEFLAIEDFKQLQEIF